MKYKGKDQVASDILKKGFNAIIPENTSNSIQQSIKISKKEQSESIANAIAAYQDDVYVPDVILVFKAGTEAQVVKSVNFNINLIASSFESFLALSPDQQLSYLMIKNDDDQLSTECANLALKMKLLNDYNYDIFDKLRKQDFEPFRSTQRQEITLKAIKKIIDIEQLRSQKLLKDVFLMHTVSGTKRIEETWFTSERWYWPQPLSSYSEYFLEGKQINFSSITILRQYFGEKISFYYAFSSFYTCYLLLLAIPGLIIEILVIQDGFANTHEQILPIWVVYNILATTLVTERWKRKESEIATRWGTLDLATDNAAIRQIRPEFSGDDYISEITGALTKYNGKSVTAIYFILSFPVLLVLLAGVIFTFFLTNRWKQVDSSSQYASGIVNGVVISILNYIYGKIARFFVTKENHKYSDTYEQSLIFKNFLFKFLNSFLGLFYIAYFNSNSQLQDMFYTLLSLVVTRQATGFAFSTLVPMMEYKLKEKRYFSLLRAKSAESQQNTGLKESEQNQRSNSEGDSVLKRPVLDCKKGENSNYLWGLTQMELESFKPERKDLVDYYGDIFIQLGYITMFAAAFPLGASIALVGNIWDIRQQIFVQIKRRAKLKSALYYLKRPSAEKVGGIGDWLYVWEIMSVIGIYTNAALLYWKTNTTWYNLNGQDRLWLYIIAVHVILVLKYMVVVFIKDKPKWVIKEEERRKFIEEESNEKFKDHMRDEEKKEEERAGARNGPRKKTAIQKNSQHLNLNNDGNVPSQLHLSYIYNRIERELLIARLKDLAIQSKEIIIKCNICRKERSAIECISCNEKYCQKCYSSVHGKVVLYPHPTISLQNFKEVSFVEKQNTEEKHLNEDNSQNHSLWRKFEIYSFPTQQNSEFYNLLEEAFKILVKIYLKESEELKNSKIDGPMNQSKISQIQQSQGEPLTAEFLKLNNFNIEEKLMLNRIVFLNCRKKGKRFGYADFLRQIKIFQDGSFESKIFLLFDMMDEDDDGKITKDDLLKIVQTSFIQNLKFENEIEEILAGIFQHTNKIDKKTAFRIFEDDKRVFEILKVFLQIKIKD